MLRGSDPYHVPVLFDEVMEAMAIRPDGVYLDGTCGGGGHSLGLYERLGREGKLYCLDRDPNALEAAATKLDTAEHKEASLSFVRSAFADFDQAIPALAVEKLDGVLLDLGVSSAQLDRAERGFSYMQEGPLDMRMDPSQRQSAREFLRDADEAEIRRVLWDYGEERYARAIAAAIVKQRQTKELTTTTELSELILHAIPPKARREKQHPAKRSFQALRIAVNGELEQLEDFLRKIPQYMNEGGRILIISFHSLEDRLVKNAMRMWESPCICPKSFPSCVCGRKSLGKVLEKKGRVAAAGEEEFNPRARSARLRYFVRNAEPYTAEAWQERRS